MLLRFLSGASSRLSSALPAARCTMRLCGGGAPAAAAVTNAAACSRRPAVWHACISHRASSSSPVVAAAAARLGTRPRTTAAAAAAAPAAAPATAAPLPLLQAPLPELSFAGRPGVWDSSDGSRVRLKSLTFPELTEWVASTGANPSKALPLWKALYADGRWARSLDEEQQQQHDSSSSSSSSSVGSKGIADLQLPRALKAAVAAGATLDAGMTLQSAQTARDGTHKLVFSLHGDGASGSSGSVETVLIPMHSSKRGLRYTACLSSQVGCAMNCQFCFTGRMGLLRNLTTAQIIEQLVEARRWLADYHSSSSSGQAPQAPQAPSKAAQQQQQQQQAPPRINNIVFMGMGEPFHNPDALWPSLDILTSPQGLGLSRNKVIVSTVGLLPEMRRLRASGAAKLAVSLHATTEELRSWLVPANRKYPLAELVATLEELYPLEPAESSQQEQPGQQQQPEQQQQQQRRRQRPASDDFVVIEYVLLRDVNDGEADARRLLQLLDRVYCMINLIVFNPHDGTSFERTDDETAARFLAILQAGGKVATLRCSKGDDDTMAACGQLGGASMDLAPRPAPLLRPPAALAAALPGAAAAAAALPPRRARRGPSQPPGEQEQQQAAAKVSVG